ncbi:MAG: flagellar basal body P-ring protein FlgI [Phycisphaerae bacterium]
MSRTLRILTAGCTVVLAAPALVLAVKIGDVTHLHGARPNRLIGIGLVTGLNGKGDGGKFAPTIRPLAEMLANFSNPTSLEELGDARNVALVNLEVVLPEYGVREGDGLDVQVTALGAAKSLVGGRLFISPLLGPSRSDRRVFALAGGLIEVPDSKSPNRAIVRRGAVMERDVIHHYINDGAITLVLSDVHAGWGMASNIALIVNEDQASSAERALAARAIDPKNVVIVIPPVDRGDPASFIARIESLELLMPAAEARVVINRTKGTIVVTGDVEIAPVWFSQNGLTIQTFDPIPSGTPEEPVVTEMMVAALDTTGRKSAKLQDLVAALNRLHVSADRLIDLVETMHRTGRIHARLIYED